MKTDDSRLDMTVFCTLAHFPLQGNGLITHIP